MKSETSVTVARPRLRRLAFGAVVLGILSVIASLFIGWAAFDASVASLDRKYTAFYAEKAHMLAAAAASHPNATEGQLLQAISDAWATDHSRPADEYMCVADRNAVLLMHTRFPEAVGSYVGDNGLSPGGDRSLHTVRDLCEAGESYTGEYVSSAGERQLAAFHPIAGRDWMVGVHRSEAALRTEVRTGVLPLVVGFLLVCGVLLPASLILLYRSSRLSLLASERAQAGLRSSEELYRAIAEDAPVLICRYLPGGVITYVNDAYCRYFEKPREELIGRSFLSLIPEADHHAVMSNIAALSVDAPVQSHEHPVLAAGGEIRWQRWMNRALFDADGRVTAHQSVGEDITERRQAEKKRRELETRLRTSQKMEAIGQLAGGVAHDFNNILTAILGNAELAAAELRARYPGAERALAGLEQVNQGAQRAAALTRQLLTFGRRDVIRPEVLNLNEVLARMDQMVRRLIAENITFQTETDPDLKPAWINTGQFEQVVVNLVVNAAQAMPDGGALTVETRNVLVNEEPARDRAAIGPGSYAVLAVRDTGHGMDAATIERIFEPFFTTKPAGKGTGLGLATVHGIVTQAGGHITVDSEPGHGTTFEVYLPVIKAAVAAQVSAGQPDTKRRGSETVLLCEDDRRVCDLTAESLRGAGYAVLTAHSGHAAIETARAHDGPIDLLIADVIMPDLGGRPLAERFRADRPELAILFISGYTPDVIVSHGVTDEDAEFLAKPFTRGQLLEKVGEVLTKTGVGV